MKKLTALIILFVLCLSLFSCSQIPDAEEMLDEFLYSYSAEGVVYSPSRTEGEDGYVYDGLMEKIYVYDDDFPENYAVFLNTHTDYGAECAVFVCGGEEERARVTDMCEERIDLLGRGSDDAFILRSGNIVFYSTMRNREKAEAVIKKILAAHT